MRRDIVKSRAAGAHGGTEGEKEIAIGIGLQVERERTTPVDSIRSRNVLCSRLRRQQGMDWHASGFG